jgi:hypothetical protein
MNAYRKISLAAAALFLAGSVASAAPALADGGACLAAAHDNDSAKSYRAIMTSGLSGKTTVSTIDIVKPDRFHETGTNEEMIAIGHKAWMRMGSAGWKSLPGMDVSDLFSTTGVKFKNTNGLSCVDAGMGLWHGQPAHIYKGASTSVHGPVHSTLYVMSDGYVHHIEMTTTSGNVEMDFTNFNSASVNPP